MSQTQDEINEFLMGGSGKAFEFETIGATCTGTIVNMQKRQQTDFQTGALMTWADGSPRMMLQITLQTGLRDNEEDDGLRNLYLRGGNYTAVNGKGTASLVAVKEAVKRANSPIAIGGMLSLTFSGEGPAPTKGMNRAKLYLATYEAPTATVTWDDLA